MQRPKFQVQQKIMDFSSKIRRVLGETICQKHDARLEEPCWWVPAGSNGNYYAAICGPRSRMQYTGAISDFANRTKRPTKETR